MGTSGGNRGAIRGVLGVFFAILIGVGGWFIAPATIDLMAANINGFTGNELPAMQMQIVFTVVIFVLGLLVSSLLLALIIPNDKQTSSEVDAAKAKAAMDAKRKAERAAARKR